MKKIFVVLQLLVSVAVAAESSDALIEKGDAFDRQLKTRDALSAYLEAEKQTPKVADLLRKIAKQYAELMPDDATEAAKRADGERALEYAKRAVAIDPHYAKGQLSLAICYGRLASLVDNRTKIEYSRLVKESVDRAIQLDASDDYAWHVLGVWNYELANLNPVLRGIAGLIYGSLPAASDEKAVEYLKKSVELAPQRVSHHVELGRAYAALGRKDLARAELQRGLALPSKEKDDEETKRRAREALADL